MSSLRFLLFLASGLLVGSLNAQTRAGGIQDVRKIYVASLGNGEGADVIRSKVINSLVKSRRVEVVENENDADAILAGASQVSAYTSFSATTTTASGGTSYRATAGVRLIGRNSRILWVDDTSSSMFTFSASGSIASRISKDLLKAISGGGRRD